MLPLKVLVFGCCPVPEYPCPLPTIVGFTLSEASGWYYIALLLFLLIQYWFSCILHES
jgi:hypothetical protein